MPKPVIYQPTRESLSKLVTIQGDDRCVLAVYFPGGLTKGRKSLEKLAEMPAELLSADSLTADELADACITLTNLGVYGIDSFIAIVTPGQCAVLAVGNITEACVPKDGKTEVRRIMTLNLAADRRIVTSPYAAKFINHFVQQLQSPRQLIE